MTSEMHLYTFGSDPFQLRWGDVTVFVHQGVPPIDVSPAPPPKTTTIGTPTQLGGTYQNYIVAPSTSDDMLEILDSSDTGSIDLGVGVGVVYSDEGGTARDSGGHERETLAGTQLAAIHEALTTFGNQHDVVVHVIHDSAGKFGG